MQSSLSFQPQTITHHLWSVVVFFLLSFFLASCSSKPVQSFQTITVYSTSSAQPWMNEVYVCADKLNIIVRVNAENPQIYLRIGEPDELFSPAYQIDEEEILVVTHRESSLQNLSLEEAQALFSGLGDESGQVWVYPSELDLQGLFDQAVMQGRSVTSSAQVAVNPQQMSDVLNTQSDTVGILSKRWKAGDLREVYSLGTFPVLAILTEEPQGAAASVLACLQNN